ncbi:MAG: TonB-dependent receptor [Melioribacteraceae bacterium]|nr:TonB-dependent receptor [Melioribacteraceae bacterium]
MKRLMLLIIFLPIVIFGLEASKGKISGKVIDSSTKEPVPGVNVVVVGTNLGASTDLDGNFVISGIDIGTYQIRISSVGYATMVKTDIVVNSAKPTELLIELIQETIEFESVNVKANYFMKDPNEIGSISNFSYEEIRRAPGGFEDVVRALTVLPGVAQTSAGRNDLIVRGGAPSENLYIVDGFIVPNINHFGTQGATGGPISYINLDYVRETTFSTGGFSSLYGDKLSSVLSIELRDGRKDKIGGKGTISASQFGFNLEGPISNKGNFIFSVRRSYLDFIFNAAGFNFVPEYYDVLSKINYDINQKEKLSFLFISAFDKVKFNNKTSEDRYENSRILGSNQNSYVTGISYRKLIPNGFYTLTLGRNFTDFDSSQKDSLLNPIFQNISREGENELKGDLVYKLSKNSELNFGASVKTVKFSADIKLPTFITTFGERLSLSSVKTKNNFVKSNIYGQYNTLLLNKLRLNLGARLDYFNGIESKYYFNPRISFTYLVGELATLNLSIGQYSQSPSYIWLAAIPSNKNLKAVTVNQIVLGYERNLTEDLKLKLEGFSKRYFDYPTSLLRPYLVLANTGAGYVGTEDNFSSFGFEPLVSKGKGNVNGVELSLQKKASEIPHYGIISITYSKARFAALDGIERDGSYDQRLIINATGGYIFNESWEASLKFKFATGNPYTPFNNDGTQSVINYNTKRFKSFHSIDLRVDKRWDFDGWNLITYLDIQNIYNNKNTNIIRWDYRKNKVAENNSIGILPSIGVSLEF